MESVSFLFIIFVCEQKVVNYEEIHRGRNPFAATMLVSCGGLQSFTFDQLYPAEVTFPEQVRTVAVVNHAPAIPSLKRIC